MYPKSYWNYRVVRKKVIVLGKECFYYGVHEIYYKNGKPTSITAEPVSFGYWEELEELSGTYEMIGRAFTEPVLNYEDIVKEIKDGILND